MESCEWSRRGVTWPAGFAYESFRIRVATHTHTGKAILHFFHSYLPRRMSVHWLMPFFFVHVCSCALLPLLARIARYSYCLSCTYSGFRILDNRSLAWKLDFVKFHANYGESGSLELVGMTNEAFRKFVIKRFMNNSAQRIYND